MVLGRLRFGGMLGLFLVAVVLVSLGAGGCGYAPQTKKGVASELDARDEKLRADMNTCVNTSKQELIQRLDALDRTLSSLQARLSAMEGMEVTLNQVRADVTNVRVDLQDLRSDIRSNVRRELGDALKDAGEVLRAGTAASRP